MQFIKYTDVKEFYKDTYDILMRHEAQNLILLGNLITGNKGEDKTDWRDPASWFMALVMDDVTAGSRELNPLPQIKLIALMTPPWNITLYAVDNLTSNEAISCLVEGIMKNDVPMPGVITENKLGMAFAKTYSEATGKEYRINKNMRQYVLTDVNPEISITGKLRLSRKEDMAFLPYWKEGFQHDCFSHPAVPKSDPEPYHYLINTGRLYIMENDGIPVSMAMINREMQNVCGVSNVYTPPYFRGKGYASSCVAELSRIILKKGYKSCVLYTDLDNPTSNSIYQKIGYKPICDSCEILFH